jgi:RNA polymerase sigma factor (sigma-70 family)
VALREEELAGLCDDVDLDRDRALVERCQAGDSAAFGNLYARYYERLLRFCLRRLNDRHEAEDAAQEAFARAWKALPRFAGERRFYPWLTVIAGNICTDMLRRRSRSTPTDDMELTAQRPVGVVGEDTSEDLVLAAVDGELVNRALDRLSTRHRHVLAMREGSGWTYQQIADHEGVEIGTIETLLWRARQALKREFAVVSESKEALAGFLIAAGALIRRTVFRAAHRGATVHHNSGGGSGAMRNAVAGVAVTGAAVAAAFIAPHALSSGPSGAASAPGSALAAPPLVLGSSHLDGAGASGSAAAQALALGGSADGALSAFGLGTGGGGTSGRSGSAGDSGNAGGIAGLLGGALGGGSSKGTGGLSDGLNQTAGGLNNTVNSVTGGLSQTVSGASGGLGQAVGSVTGGLGQTVGGVTSGLGQTVTGVTGGVTQTVGGVTNSLSGVTSGVTQTVSGVTSGAPGGTSSVGGLNNTLGGVTSGVNGLTQSIGLGTVIPSSSGSGTSSSSSSGSTPATTTTTTTNPVQGVLDGTTKTVGGLLGG